MLAQFILHIVISFSTIVIIYCTLFKQNKNQYQKKFTTMELFMHDALNTVPHGMELGMNHRFLKNIILQCQNPHQDNTIKYQNPVPQIMKSMLCDNLAMGIILIVV